MGECTQNNIEVISNRIKIEDNKIIFEIVPQYWIKEVLKSKENKVFIRMHPDGSLIITPNDKFKSSRERVKSYSIHRNTKFDDFKQVILSDFKNGIEIIKLKPSESISNKLFQQLYNFVDENLIGFDTIFGEHTIDIINMAQMPKFDIYRLFDIISNYCSKIINNCSKSILLQEVEDQLNESMKIWERSLYRHSNLMIRGMSLALHDFLIADHINLQIFDILNWFKVNQAMTKIAHHASSISNITQNSENNSSKKTVYENLFEYSEYLSNLFSSAIGAFTACDTQIAMKIKSDRRKVSYPIIYEKQLQASKKLDFKEISILHNLQDIEYYIDIIADAALDRTDMKI